MVPHKQTPSLKMSAESNPESAEQKTELDLGRQQISLELQTENLIETYQILAEWIRFADAKAAVVLTVGLATAGLLAPTLKEYLSVDQAQHLTPWWSILVWSLFGGCFLFLLLSLTFSFWCLLPFRHKGEHPARAKCAHFHAVGIASKYGINDHDAFMAGYKEVGVSGYQKEVLAGLLIDAHISVIKYRRVTISIRWFALSVLFAFAYLISIQL